ncbi:MAG: hypothetical protein IJ088_09415 [Clostridia bacterium]|nr:hypothetical protein [Clostridia bacterium]
MSKIEKNHWHPGYLGAMEIELKENKADLDFDEYHKLSKEPLEIDLLIIEKAKGLVIKNEIGSIFRQFNVTEYKSPGDDMNISNYVKTVGYACVLKGTEPHVDDVPLSELTVTLVRDEFPEALFRSVEQEGGTYEKKFSGIYYIYGLFNFPTQVIVGQELDPKLHPSLRILSRNAKEEDIEEFIRMVQAFTDSEDQQNADAVLQVSISANAEAFENVKRRNPDMCKAMKDLMKEEIQEERVDAAEQERVINIKSMMENLKLSASQAMDALNIPISEQRKYIAML